MKRLGAFLALACLAALTAGFGDAPASSGPASSEIELVQSIPQETDLAIPGMADCQQTWIDLFRGATQSIDIAQMYVTNDVNQPLEPVMQELEAAGKRGVQIRFLLSQNMITNDPQSVTRLKAIPNLTLRVLDLSKLTGGILHAKYFVVDGQRLYVGSQNFDWRALDQIHETGILVRDAAMAAQLDGVFQVDWQIAQTNQLPAATPQAPLVLPPPEVELTASPAELNPPGTRATMPVMLDEMAKATTSIHIAVMEYSETAFANGTTWTELTDAMKTAAARGVQVELLVSNWNVGEPEITQIKALGRVPGITIKIISIPELSSGHIAYARVMHTKFMVVDDQMLMVSTSNWEKSYFYATRDIEIFLRRPEFGVQGEQMFEKLWDSSLSALLDQNATYHKPNTGP